MEYVMKTIKNSNTEELTVLGTSVTHLEVIKKKAESDLGFPIKYITLDGTEAQRVAALSPQKFDVYDQWFHDLDLIWPTKSLQAIDINRVAHWDDISESLNSLKVSCDSKGTPGGSPFSRLFIDSGDRLTGDCTEKLSMLPTVYNADTFAMVGKKTDYANSWAALFDPEFSGQVSIQNDAAIGVIDCYLAYQSYSGKSFKDAGNFEIPEIDELIDFLLGLKKKKHFAQFWKEESEVANAINAQRVQISSMWWQGFVYLRRLGININMCTPKEGYRGWFGGLSISSEAQGKKLDMAYRYLNWWLDGFAGASMTRNGAYVANPKSTKKFLEKDEWNYWYEGRETKKSLKDPFGNKIIDPGEVHEGGNYLERRSNIAICNSVMDEHNYLSRRWLDVQE